MTISRTPAQAGVQLNKKIWTPAFAGEQAES